jgi:hypothetical protein
MPRRWLLAAAFLGLLIPLTAAEELKPDPVVERIKKDLSYLAGDECEGRGLKTKGIVRAGDYIAKAFKEAGLKPAIEGSYFQPFKVYGKATVTTPVNITFTQGETSTELKIREQFIPTQGSSAGKFQGGLVFAGYGITGKTSDGKAYDDYAGLDVKGKIVIVLRRMPNADAKTPPFEEYEATFTAKIENAIEHKAAGILFVSDRGKAGKTDDLIDPSSTAGAVMSGPVYHLKRSAVDLLLKAAGKPSLAELEEGIDKTVQPNSFALPNATASGEVTVGRTTFDARNVVGYLEGSGPLANETIVIGAHYDHLGLGDEGSSTDPKPQGKVHYGADDNASGTSGLLELARRYGAMKERQGRRIVFAAFSAEEKGLFGSLEYVKHPPFPLDKTVFMINMDMIGRMVAVADKDDDTKKQDRLVVYGTGTDAGLDALVEKTNKAFNFKMMKVPGGRGPSDHTSFYNKKIPVLFLFTGTHKDYHKSSDTPEKINYAGLRKIVDFIQVFADHYSKVDAKSIVYQQTKGGGEDPTDPNSGVRMTNMPRIGIMPGNYGEENAGVLIGGVTPGSPAEKGGLKEDDLIIEMAGKPVKNMTNYMAVMGTQKAGQEMEIVVLRDKKKLTVKVVPAPPK